MSRSQNVFFCGGNNPLKYIPMMFPMWFPVGFSLTLIYQDVLLPCGTLKRPLLKTLPFSLSSTLGFLQLTYLL